MPGQENMKLKFTASNPSADKILFPFQDYGTLIFLWNLYLNQRSVVNVIICFMNKGQSHPKFE